MTLREQQLFSLEILKDVHSFCERNSIKYSLYGGTLIGAIRHKGFIPWDDDIDIIMPRPDYDRFCSTYSSENFEIINIETDETFSYAYSRVADVKKSVYKSKYPCNKKGMGCWIDVFPADGFPANETKIPEFYNRILAIEKKKNRIRSGLGSFSFSYGYNISCNFFHLIKYNIAHFIFKPYLFLCGGRNPFVRQQIAMCHEFEYGSTPFWGSITSPYKHMVYHHISDFESCLLCPFEDSSFYVLNGYDALLRRVYCDYMQLPPEEDRIPALQGAYEFYWLQ